MAVTLIYDPRSNVTNIVQYTKTEDGRRKATAIGRIAAGSRNFKRYKREEAVEANRELNTKLDSDTKTSLTEGYISAMFGEFWDEILNRRYEAVIGGTAVLLLSDESEKKREVCEKYGLTSADLKKIAVEQARLEDDWRKSLQRVLVGGFRYRDAWTSEEHRYTVRDLTQRLNRLAK